MLSFFFVFKKHYESAETPLENFFEIFTLIL